MEDISFKKAFDITINNLQPLSSEAVGIGELIGRVAAGDIFSLVDSPSHDVSLKDGYAVKSNDIEKASENNPVSLKLSGSLTAGSSERVKVTCGNSVKIMSGAVIPDGTDAVVSNEFASDDGVSVRVVNNAKPGQNILPSGTDIKKDELLVEKGTRLRPTQIGLIAAAGHSSLKAYITPRVTIIATGDEVLAVGMPFQKGKVFASNLVTISAWCSYYGIQSNTVIVKDEGDAIKNALLLHINESACLITSGGAWTGERDLVIKTLDSLGWRKLYHRVKIGPGKAIGFGLFKSKPVFCLPGGPPSNQIAFLELALPGLLLLGGNKDYSLPTIEAMLGESVRGQNDWTQFIFGTLSREDNAIVFYPLKTTSRLQMMAKADGIICIPEGEEYIRQGERVNVQMLTGY
ncbi:MAG: molybdopterin molybdotransferase MoeA [Nitrospirae bacterium]|nr:molybdopterin molybdotransferase MoeA [Nitrospirota bacterium]